MYGLKQAARLAYDNLVTNLKKDGYFPDKYCPNIWSHESRPTKFCLCVDDFGVKYFTKDDAQHLITSLQQSYDITIDCLDIEWNYDKEYVDISMKHFVIKTLQRLQHTFPSKPQYAPHSWTVPNYVINRQYAKPPDTSPLLDKSGMERVQSIVGSFLYYGRAIDNTVLVALNELATSQS